MSISANTYTSAAAAAAAAARFAPFFEGEGNLLVNHSVAAFDGARASRMPVQRTSGITSEYEDIGSFHYEAASILA